jgi:CubicO group peptidase (beta-lactamase class C family)
MSQMAGGSDGRLATGFVAAGYEPVLNELNAYLLADPEYSAQLAVYAGSDLVIDLVGGPDLDDQSITVVASSTKGASAITLGTLIDDGKLDPDRPVVDYWPEFGQAGKDRISVRQLLSHQAGLVGVIDGFLTEEVIDSRLAAAKLAAACPLWVPGSSFGYHAITIGVFMEELVRRVENTSLQELYESRIRGPREIDFYIGLPQSEESRFREILALHPTPAQLAEMESNARPQDDLSSLAFNELFGEFNLASGRLSPNNREIRAAGPAALGGIGSARGLATLYSAAIGGVGKRILSTETVALMSQEQVWGMDRVLNDRMSFGVVFMKPVPGTEFGSYRAFGHAGAGGALAFADPLYELGFGYIPNPMQYPGGADPKSIRLSEIVRACIRRLS